MIASGRNNYGAIGAPAGPSLDPAVLLFALGAAASTTLLFALVPAIAASRVDLVTALRTIAAAAGGRSLCAGRLEIAIGCLLIAASGC